MEIHELKSRLSITEVATELGIEINRQGRANCPFHNDKTPSLQFSKEKNICTCFSTNCTAGTMDIISLTEKYKNITTHQAIEYLKSMLSVSEIPQGGKALKYLSDLAGGPTVKTRHALSQQPKENYMDYPTDFEQMQSSFISSSTARNYAESRGLNWKALQIGYNAFKQGRFNYLRGCITFALRDNQNHVVSMYGRSIRDNDKAKHYYTANRRGLYPGYPKPGATKLILTESVIDTATLLHLPAEVLTEAGIPEPYSILALYGTNGLTAEHAKALQEWATPTFAEATADKEIILFFDGDEAGRAANEKQGGFLKGLLPEVQISIVETPEGEDVNSLSVSHEQEVFTHLLNNRKNFSFSNENLSGEKKKEHERPIIPSKQNNRLNTSNPYKITYPTETATYHVKGGIPKALDSLKITLEIELVQTGHAPSHRKSRQRFDLYEDKQTEKAAREAGEKLGIRADLIEMDLSSLTDLLDEYREQQLKENQPEEENQKVTVPIPEQQRCIGFLKQKELIQKFNQLIEKSGITGEENNRIFLFVIATAYKMPDTLHALIQGSSGSGKTYLSRQITGLMPKEDVIRLTRVTESSFYNYGEYELQYKLIVLEDVDGLKEEAEFAFRELQSNNEIISSTSAKDENNGNIRAQIKKVKGPIGSIATTTRGEIYEDNMSRIFLLAVDEGKEQTNRIIEYQNRKAAGMINKTEEIQTKQFIQNCIRMLKPYEVVNPFANKILLPPEAHKIRRLTELFHAFVNQVTLLNQYQRQRDKQGRLITEKEDVQTAIEIMFESIILKIDELDGSLRQFYEDLKAYIMKQGSAFAKASADDGGCQKYQFTQREIRQALKISKTQIYRYFMDLINLEYITQTGGYANRGFSYKITYWDDIKALRDRIKSFLNHQLNQL